MAAGDALRGAECAGDRLGPRPATEMPKRRRCLDPPERTALMRHARHACQMIGDQHRLVEAPSPQSPTVERDGDKQAWHVGVGWRQ